MLGIEVVPTFVSTDDLVAALLDIAACVKRGEISDEAGEKWGLVGCEERPEDGPGMWVMKCQAHGNALYVGQGEYGADRNPQYLTALRHARTCPGLTAAECLGLRL
jgi:hypothetical protein